MPHQMHSEVMLDPFSLISLHVEAKPPTGAYSFGGATAFCVEHAGEFLLITARHVVVATKHQAEAIDQFEDGTPARLVIHAPLMNGDGSITWVEADLPLYDERGRRAWREQRHSTGEPWDIAAVPLSPATLSLGGATVEVLPFGIAEVDLAVDPGEPINIIGFPWGQSAGGRGSHIAIWKTGYLAGEMSQPWNDWPCFLVDATTTPGMSGSPVYAIRRSGFRPETGRGVAMGRDGTVRRLLGVYTGKILRTGELDQNGFARNESINVGAVWRAEAIAEVLNERAPAELP